MTTGEGANVVGRDAPDYAGVAGASGTSPIALLDEPDRVRLALSPLRRRLLDRLRTPASATQLAAELTLGRQRINYHLRALEEAGLVTLIEERQRRGCVERILAARAHAFVVDPAVMGARETPAIRTAAQDRFAAAHLIDTAGAILRDVARMETRAERQGTRLLTFTIETAVSFAAPADLELFTTALAEFVTREAARLGAEAAAAEGGGRRYRVVLAGHPAPQKAGPQKAGPQKAVPQKAVPQKAVQRAGPPRPAPQKPGGRKPPSSKPVVQKSLPGDSHERVRSRPRRDPRRRPH